MSPTARGKDGLYTAHWTQAYEVYTTVFADNEAQAIAKANRVKRMESHEDEEGDEIVVLDGETCVLESWAYPIGAATVHVWDDAPIVGEGLGPPKINGALRSRFRKYLKERNGE